MTWDLKLADGRVVQWDGLDGLGASTRYVDCHPGTVVVAWRRPTAQGTVSVLGAGIITP